MNYETIGPIAQALLAGVVVTVEVSIGALFIAVVWGGLLASLRFLYPSRMLDLAISTYVEIFRNIPTLTHLLIVYFGLAYFGVTLPSLAAAILALGLIGGAVMADVFRAGFQAVPIGQTEAALATGLPPLLTFRLVIFPQALRIILPPSGNYAVGLVKDTSLVAAISAPEIMFNARQIVNVSFQTGLVYGTAAMIYLALTFLLTALFYALERKAAY
ncbi:amino acid ABC transporter permease [Aliirhizobium smilacinae]|uniref:Amino acid ABC transporter permease n=1 Tax=Aliirhizobium smilacinae TaxID=1395944 RepID=A0A5C4XS01_9HYPH|nr:amino acid ABC transporter permease [Rhizobium smilacinae]TNM65374.1 amino acid ABC transporter permease [Rhizobium smilacinae]